MSEFDSTTKHKQMHDTNEEDEIQLKYFSIDIKRKSEACNRLTKGVFIFMHATLYPKKNAKEMVI